MGAHLSSHRSFKGMVAGPLVAVLRVSHGPRKALRRIVAFSRLKAALSVPLPTTVVVEGHCMVDGTGRIHLGEDCLLYPELHLETRGEASIQMGEGCVLSRGVHLVAMAGISIGDGSMIGEYSSLRDANHRRSAGIPLRDAGHVSCPITLGRQVWIGRGVTVLGGVTIGDFATVGANAVVTRDVSAHAIVAGVPAKPILRSSMRATADIDLDSEVEC